MCLLWGASLDLLFFLGGINLEVHLVGVQAPSNSEEQKTEL